MYELAMVGAAVMTAFSVLANQKYQQFSGSGLGSAIRFALWSSVIGVVAALAVQVGRVEFTWFSVLISLWASVNGVIYTLFSLYALEKNNLTMYTTFSMLGGMLLPFLAGILIWQEPLTWQKGVCCLLLIFSIVCNVQLRGGSDVRKGLFYGLAVFFLNGLGGLINKIHQSYPDLAVDSGSYSIIFRAWIVLICLAVLLFNKQTPMLAIPEKKKRRSAWKSLLIYGVLALVSSWIYLVALLHVEASFTYVLITGSVIVCTTLLSLILRERVTKRQIVSVVIAVLGMVCLAL